MEKVRRLNDHIAKFTKGVGCVSFICVVIMMLLNVVDVLLTKLFSSPIIGTYEITQRLLMCAVFAAFAYGQTEKSHINMTLVIVHLPRPLRFTLFTLMSIISVFASAAMTYAAIIQAGVARAANYTTEVLYIPLYPFYYIEFIAMAIFTLAILYDTVLYAIAIFRDDYAEMVQEHWS